jgi:LysM repeat protein
MRLRSVVCAGVALAAFTVPADSLRAAPPLAQRMVAAAVLPSRAQWISHEIVSGESLGEIADRYAVAVGSILRWNQLDPRRPQFWVGEQLKVLTQLPDRVRTKYKYIVRPDDTWESVAERFHVDMDALQRFWNPSEAQLQPGHQLVVWVEPEVTPEPLPEPNFGIEPVKPGAVSVGYPDSGRLSNGVQIPMNPNLYTLRNLDHAYGSTHAVGVLQQSIATFRLRTGFDREVILWDMSTKTGGHFGPHRSHRSGRDIDIALPLKPGYIPGLMNGQVDWEATWHLIRTFVETGEVRYVFLSRARQAALYQAAKGCGATPEELDRFVQYPRTTKVGIVRHAPGHEGHLHVRFTCGTDEATCFEVGGMTP